MELWDNPDTKITEAPMDQSCHQLMNDAVKAYVADFDKHRAAGNIPDDENHVKNTMIIYSVVFNAISAVGRNVDAISFEQIAQGINQAYNDQLLAAEQAASIN